MAASEPAHTAPQPPASAEAWWNNSFMVTFEFRCNLACSFCMVEDVLDVYAGTSLQEFQRAATVPGMLRGAKRIIFSGGEVTLSDELLDYVRFARSLPGIEHVRLQTNAVRLGRRDVLETLFAAGVDEFFVSIHGHDDGLCDELTRKKGSFRAILAGLEAIAAIPATLITNTAIVASNYRYLPDIVQLVSRFRPRSMEFWNYWPRADEDGARGLAARVGDVREPLLQALRACIQHGFPPVVKWFPRCLLGELAWCQDDGQPPAIIEDGYFARAPSYACLYEGVCADAAGKCCGLSHQYIRRFGWEQQLLVPRRTRPPGTERGDARRSLTQDRVTARGESMYVSAWLEQFGITPEVDFAGYRMVEGGRSHDHREIGIRFEREGEIVEARLRLRDPGRPCFARTRSFDVLGMRPQPGREAVVRAVLQSLATMLAAGDMGGAELPP